MVKISFKQLDDLKTKLINAIQVRLAVSNVTTKQLKIVKVLADIPESKAALENVNVFKKAWVDQVLISFFLGLYQVIDSEAYTLESK